METREQFEHLHDVYTPRTMDLLEEIKDSIEEELGVKTEGPHDMTGDNLCWWLVLPAEDEAQVIVIEIACRLQADMEDVSEEETGGANFIMTITRDQGLIMGNLCIHQYDKHCWDAKTDEEINRRWERFKYAAEDQVSDIVIMVKEVREDAL